MKLGFPGGSVVKNPRAHAGDTGSIPGLGRSPGEGNANPLQYSCLGNPMGKRAWQATVHGVAKVRHDLATKTNKIYEVNKRIDITEKPIGNQRTTLKKLPRIRKERIKRKKYLILDIFPNPLRDMENFNRKQGTMVKNQIIILKLKNTKKYN